MIVSLVQEAAAALPPHQATTAVLLAGAFVAFAFAVWARNVSRTLPAALFVALAALALWPRPDAPPPLPTATLVALAALALAVHLLGHRQRPDESPGCSDRRNGGVRSNSAAARAYLAAVLTVAAILLLHDLGGYTGALLGWESSVVYWYAQAVLEGRSLSEYVAITLLWDNGLVSSGNTSLFYGAPTWLLFHAAGYSTWTLRVFSVLATLLGIGVMYAFARRFFGAFVAAAAASLYGLNALVLFYGRYGTSPAGTLLATLLALWSVWAFLDRERPAWWMGPLCVLALYVATLQYAPARLVVLFLLAFIALLTLWQWRRLHGSRALGLALIAAGALGVWQVQTHFHTQYIFVLARGEQVLSFFEHRDYLRQLLGREVEPAEVQWSDKVEIVGKVLRARVPEYLDLMRPRLEPGGPGFPLNIDPPPLQLYFAPLVVFVVWGVLDALLRRSWRDVCLLLLVAGCSVPLLLSNRVDPHRTALFVIPLTLFAALGLRQAALVLDEARVPRWLQHLLAVALGLTLVLHDVDRLFYLQTPTLAQGQAIADELAAVPGPAFVGARFDHRQVSWLQLQMLERARLAPERAGRLLDEATVLGLEGDGLPAERPLQEIERLTLTSTVFLAPAARFKTAAAVFRHRGLRVTEGGPAHARFLRVEKAGG